MIPVYRFCLKKVAVMGLGKSGQAAVRALLAGGASVDAWDDNPDSRAALPRQQGLWLRDLANPAQWSGRFGRYSAMLWSPGIPHTHPKPHPVADLARQNGLPLICDVELLLQSQPWARTVGITGTNGKSTTTALIGHLFAKARMPYQVGGNIGTSALMLKPLDSQGTYVLELSSYQLELTPSLSPDVAVLLNVSADHLERHGGFDGYIQAKREIFKNQYGTKSSVIGIDDPHGFNLHATLKREAGRVVIPISGQTKAPGGVYVLDGILFDDMDGRNKRVLDLDEDCPTLPGEHNHQNAAAAYATARLRGIPPEIIKAALPSFPGLAHRQELVATINGIEYVNDSKATNADAADKAMDCYDDIYWIVGGRPAEGGINALSRHFPHVRKAFLIGEAEAAFAEVLGKAGVALERCGTLDRAVKAAHEAAQADAIEDAAILLSPACKSWDQFPNFETRGDAFRSLVQGLGKQGGGAS